MSKLSLEQITYLYALLSVEGIGPGRIRSLLARFKTLESVFSSDYESLIKVERISTNLAKRVVAVRKNLKKTGEWLESEIIKLQKFNAKLITIWDEEYPELLKKIYDPPLILQVKGNLTNEDNFSISMVGTRLPSNYGKIYGEKIAAELAGQNITIVSGMARGIDSICHSAALKKGGRTIAIVGSGLDVIYPAENKKLFEQISEHGAVVSEFTLGTKPDAQNFPRRNRIISGLSLGCIIIETQTIGGAMQTARFALDQNREVFALPGNVGSKQSEGTNYLIQRGEAQLIRSAEDVLIALELKLKPILGKNIPKQQEELNLFEEKLINALNTEPIHIDKIASLANLSTSDSLVHLLSLEFKGLVKQFPGKMFALL
ncbi:DNA-processing protein DprA [bacterium BMS3Abin03]|nr:DNA-processing protein DprA [bacterium BMS3Abin03]